MSKQYFLMHSGQRIYIDSFNENNVNLDDIAHHLTKICRYGGGLEFKDHWSVAGHSISLSVYAMQHDYSIDDQRALLMHDATEAYLGDVNGILKRFLPDYLKIEERFRETIFNKYNILWTEDIKKVVEDLDKRILLDEAKKFYKKHYEDFSEQYLNLKPLDIQIYSELAHMDYVKAMFLHNCKLLGIKD